VSEKRIRATTLVAGILLICIGSFLFVLLLDFEAAKSLHFSDGIEENSSHFLGWTGMRVSSTLVVLMGRAAYLFGLILIYFGYTLLRKIRPIVKAGFILIGVSSIFFLMGVLSLGHRDALYRGGGLFGRFIVQLFSPPLSKTMLIVILLTLFAGTVFILSRRPVALLLLKIRRFSGGSTGNSSKRKKVRVPELLRRNAESVDGGNGSGGPRKAAFIGRHGQKLPLFSKVYVMDDAVMPPRMLKKSPGTPKSVKASPKMQDPEKPKQGPLRASSYLKKSSPANRREQERETERKAAELERTLKEFGIDAKVIGIIRGPVITRYELQPAPGVKLSRIENLSNNIALNLSANGVRIEAPIPGRAAVGIEIPNDEHEIVTLGDIIDIADKRGELPLILGRDISGDIVVSDLTTMPHLLIAGATGSGKSVCVNSLIMSILSQKGPDDVRLLMIDPKMVELKIYNGIPHLLTEVVTDPRDAAKALRWVLYEMENRYRLLDENFVRNIAGYNRKMSEKMPYIVILVDEFANLMAISQKDVEEAVVRLAAMSRAVGIHLIMATQRPSVDVITGLIKANFPFRIAFQVASKTDSRTILDSMGAEKLLGRGDMLFSPAGSMNIKRIQGAFVSEDEVHRVVQEMRKSSSPEYIEDIFDFGQEEGFNVDFDDPLFKQAVEIVIGTKRASASFLQRRLKIGYNRAARLIELMEDKGIIGPPRGSRPREIYVENLD
jgi:DNA segregation ATPase FtsK/SpoIIIE-like protein